MIEKDGRSVPHQIMEEFRFAAIKLHAQKVDVAIIAKTFKVSVQAVYSWISKSKQRGIISLKSTKTTGRPPLLSNDQFNLLFKYLRQPASKLDYATDLWSGPRIRHLIKHRLGIVYHPKHMPRLLRRLGLVMKFPERRSLEQDPKAVREWKTVRLPEIMEDAKNRHSLVFYADESLISLIPYVGRTWTFPDKMPKVRVSGKRGQHVGVTGAVNAQGRSCFDLTADKEKFTAVTFIRFIRRLRKEFPGRNIIIIADGSSTHKAKLVISYQNRHKDWLRIEILPAYSPELNFSEKAWGFIKTKARNGSQASNKEQLREETLMAVTDLKKNKKRVKTFFSK